MFFTVYILTNLERTIFYTGVTGVLQDCIFDHKIHQSKRVECWRHSTRLVYFENFEDVCVAIDRLDTLTLRLERWEIDFIRRFNPCWVDLSQDWYDHMKLAFYKQWHSPLFPAKWQ